MEKYIEDTIKCKETKSQKKCRRCLIEKDCAYDLSGESEQSKLYIEKAAHKNLDYVSKF
jgi:hypothetical protein